MLRRRVIAAFAFAAVAGSVIAPAAASAHNAGHIDVGSGKHHEHADKYPETPGDEYGARWAADQGNTPVYPRHCDDPRPDTHNHPA
jgi:hypothetical protein